MTRRIPAVLVLAAVCLAPIASAADKEKNLTPVAQVAIAAPPALNAVFAHVADEVTRHEDGMLVAVAPKPHVIFAKITPEGEVASACVDNHQSAESFVTKGKARSTKTSRKDK